tara:strand:+ start:19 stop:222 length:204 start_codon:yes stop_codon:yes gene_type:complete
MKGNVHGLPTAVPIAEAIKLPRISQAITAPSMKCNPTNGVKEIAAPQAKPAAIEYGVPGSLFILVKK